MIPKRQKEHTNDYRTTMLFDVPHVGTYTCGLKVDAIKVFVVYVLFDPLLATRKGGLHDTSI